MKKIIILSGVLLMALCACKNSQTVSDQPVPETFDEFMDSLNNLEECFEYSVSSDDSVTAVSLHTGVIVTICEAMTPRKYMTPRTPTIR